MTGQLALWERPGASGATTRCHFCPACGTRIYHRSSRSRTTMTLKAGTLDDTTELRVQAHLWVRRKQPWLTLDPALPAFDTQPDDLHAWRKAMLEALHA